MRRTLILAGTLTALLALTAFIPATMASERHDDAKDVRDDRMELRADRKDLRDDLRDSFQKRFMRGNISLELSGSGMGRDNATYTFTIDASGKGLERMKERDGDFRVFRGVLLAKVVVKDGNGTVVKDGDVRLKLFARHTDDGNWTWQIVSFGKRPNGMPRLVLRGDAEKVAAGEFKLAGKGHMVIKLDGAEKATPIKVTEVSGKFTRELPVPPPTPAKKVKPVAAEGPAEEPEVEA